MKKIISYFLCTLSVFILCSMFSCSSEVGLEELEQIEDNNEVKTCELILNVEKISFDDDNTRSVNQWKNGDKIYLTFSISSGFSYGDAVYIDGSWSLNYYGSLTEGVASQCIAVYFDNPKYASSSVIQVSEETGIYEDFNGQYVYNNGVLSVSATLSPKTGRIRFAGESTDSITVYGISHYTSYDVSNGKYTSSEIALKTKTISGYTPYIYGTFSDTIQPRLNIITSSSGYTRLLPTTMYKKGESGYMSVPTEEVHNGWLQSVIFKVNDVEFTMIPVEYSEGFFLLAETETTEQLYNAILGLSATESRLPKTMSYGVCNTFISKINYLTGLNFNIPSKAEWQHAFKGGNKTQNFLYSGSNIISDVAWYSGNSDVKKHEVKQLQPNELGFYDMSGNVSECVLSGNTYYYFGGFYNSDTSGCKGTHSGGSEGFRIALKP